MKVKFNRKKARDELGLRTVESYIRIGLDGIKKLDNSNSPFNIEPKIHRMRVSGKYGIKILREHLGKLYTNKKFIPKYRMPNYQKMHFGKHSNFRLVIFTEPIKPKMPICYIEIHPQGDILMKEYKEFLLWLNKALPGLNVSSVEYANDQYCTNPEAVEELFNLEKRFLYIPYKRGVTLYNGEFLKLGKNVSMNSTYRVGDVKIYERGPDKEKKGKGWVKNKTDRVRLEYTAPRKKLKDSGIKTLTNFISSPEFYQINKGIYNFKYFDGSKKLPKIWEDYLTEDKNGNCGIFQLEFILQKKKVKNMGQYLKDVPQFDEFKSRLENEWQRFNQEWSSLKIHPLQLSGGGGII